MSERFAGRTPGKWKSDGLYVWTKEDHNMVADFPLVSVHEEKYLARMRGVGRGATEEEQAANAELMAAGPDLLEELAAKDAKIAEMEEELFKHEEKAADKWGPYVKERALENRELQDQIRVLRDALSFYADSENHRNIVPVSSSMDGNTMRSPVYIDYGEKAKEALKSTGSSEREGS